jgi:hypothetical protein
MASPTPQPPETHDTRAYWIDQCIALAIIAIATDLRHDYAVPSYITMALGLGWLFYLRWEHKPMTPQVRTPNFLAIVVLCLATVVVGFDVIDRHYHLTSGPDWAVYRYTEVYNRTFSHETVKLDGHKFYSCTFNDVTFEYSGEGPFEFDPYPPKLTTPITIKSNIPAIKAAMNMCLVRNIANGCTDTVENEPVLP